MVLTVGDDVGVLFSGSRVHFQIWKYAHCQIKNSNKIGGKSEKNRGWLVTMLGVLFQGPGCISKYGKCGYAKNEKWQ